MFTATRTPGYNQASKTLPGKVDKTAHLFAVLVHGWYVRHWAARAATAGLQIGRLLLNRVPLLEAIALPCGVLGWRAGGPALPSSSTWVSRHIVVSAVAAQCYGVRAARCMICGIETRLNVAGRRGRAGETSRIKS